MPRIKTTPTVTVALYVLRVYLLGMLLIILTKFVIEARRGGEAEPSPPAAASQSTASQGAAPTAESPRSPVQPTP